MSLFIKNSQNEKVLSKEAQAEANRMELLLKNSYGLDLDITTLTTVLAEVREQKFYTVKVSDFVPVRVGTGAWSTHLTSFTSEDSAADFETGFTNTSSKHAKIPNVDAMLNPVHVPIQTWNKQIDWTLPELQYANKFGAWDIVAGKESARKRNWDLGIQKIAFLGSDAHGLGGLLTDASIIPNTTAITKTISSMTGAELKALVKDIMNHWSSANADTSMPDTFGIPLNDWYGMTGASSGNFPISSVIELIRKAFIDVTGNENFTVRPVAYANADKNQIGGTGKNRYVLYRNDADTLRFEIPVDYTMTMAHTFNGYQFANVGYGQLGGTHIYRKQEVVYFDR